MNIYRKVRCAKSRSIRSSPGDDFFLEELIQFQFQFQFLE